MRRLAKTFGVALATVLVTAGVARADFGVEKFSFGFKNKDGSVATQAGSHPFAQTLTFDVNTKEGAEGRTVPDGDVKSLRFDLPPGFIGSTTAVPRCASADFLAVDEAAYSGCSNDTAIGVIQAQSLNFGQHYNAPIHNLVPPPGVAVKIGFVVYNVPVTVDIRINDKAPTNVVASLENIPQVVEFYGSNAELWGIPADHAHDPYRGRCLQIGFVLNVGELKSKGLCDTGAPEVPFLTMPRACTGPLTASFEAVSWQQPNAAPVKGSDQVEAMSGCSKLGFSPQTSAKPTTASAESSSGLDFALDVNDEGLGNPSGLAQSDVRNLIVRMAPGMTLNPSAANGLVTCPRAGYEAESLTSRPGEGCPEASQIGEIEVESALLPEGEVLRGQAFLASQDDNPFGSLVALYVVIRNTDLGILVKQAGKVEPSEEQGPNAGRIVSVFNDISQVPFSHLRFTFKEGARAPLVTPPTCGVYATETELSPWADPAHPLLSAPTFAITSGVGAGPCPPGGVPPFNPRFSAGSINNDAGAYSPFTMRLTRSDGEQNMTRFDAVLPKGMVGKIAGVAKCPAAAIPAAKAKSGRAELANPSCPAGSLIGHSMVGAGVGGTLTYVPGKLYLGGPVGSAPLSVIAITPAVAGPFDVGTVVVREGLTVDSETAEVRVDGASSDPIPHLLKGIPVKVRDLRVYADRANFTLNPTSCARKKAQATLFGSFANVFSAADDVPVSLSDRYQAASCASLKFKPNLSLKLNGGTKRGAHPAVKAVVSYPPGRNYANTHKAVVTFPHSMFLEQAHIRTVCTRVQFRASQCPAGSIYGKVRATTPLLDETLEGNVYLRSSSNPLPDLVFAFRGGAVDFNAVARVDSVNASLRVNFDSIPDVPLDKVTVEMRGGKKGLIVNSRDLCAHKSKAKADFTAHNGDFLQQRPVVKASCGKK